MHGSWKIGSVAGIDVLVHWTLALLLGWLAASHLAHGRIQMALEGVGFVVALFGCVLLHELGHALMARRYNIATRDITLLPIGGVARLERMPRDPTKELWVALAGPAVNVVLAAALFVLIALGRGVVPPDKLALIGGSFWSKLLYLNIAMALFNLIPAFPMDGGRVLRALIARRSPYLRATQIAASVGQGMAIVFAMAGLLLNWFLLFIAVFVYLGARQEARLAHMLSLLKGVTVRAVMMTRFIALDAGESIARAASHLISGYEHDFPVMSRGALVGVLPTANLMRALAAGEHRHPVAQAMVTDWGTVEDDAALDETWERMQGDEQTSIPVTRAGQLVGLITLESVGHWLQMRQFSERERATRAGGYPFGTAPRPR